MEIRLDVSDELYKLITENGLAEIVVRAAKGRIKELNKVKILEDTFEYSNDVFKNVVNELKNNNQLIKNISNTIHSVSQSSKIISKIGYLNVALNAVSLVATVAGFVILFQKMESLSVSIDKLDKKLDNLNKFNKGELIEQFEKFKLSYSGIALKIQDNDLNDYDKVINLLNDFKPFIVKIIGFFKENVIEKDILLEILSILLPSYISLLNIYCVNYYFEKNNIYPNIGIYTDFYSYLVSSEFKNEVFEYNFIDKEFSYIDATDTANIFQFAIADELIQVMDNIEALNKLKTKDNYDVYSSFINKLNSNSEEKLQVLSVEG